MELLPIGEERTSLILKGVNGGPGVEGQDAARIDDEYN